MSGLEELRLRVEAAESHFGMIAAQRETYSARLTGLMGRMEQAHADQQGEIATLNDQIGRAEAENRELRGMLLGLLQAIETRDGNGVGLVVRDLEHRIDSLVGAGESEREVDGSAPPAPTEAAAYDADDADAMLSALDDMDIDDADLLDSDPDGVTTELATADDDVAAEVAGMDADGQDSAAAFAVADDEVAAELNDAAGEAETADADANDMAVEIADVAVEDGVADAVDTAAEDLAADEFDAADMTAALADEGANDVPTELMDTDAEETAADLADAGEVATALADVGEIPAPETVTLDDAAADELAKSNPAHELLSRVDAVANALLAGGLDLDPDDDVLTGEISALLRDAIGARRSQLEADQAEAQALETAGEDISIEDWGDDALADPLADAGEEDEVVFGQEAAA